MPGHLRGVTRRRLAVPVLTATALALLTACGDSDTPAPDQAGATDTPAASTQPGEPGAGGGNQDLAPDLQFQDQVGEGDTALVARVGMPTAGFVVVSSGDTVLGSTPVQEGAATDLAVPLDPPLTEDTVVTATLYADTDGDGAFDAAADQPVPASPDDEDEGQELSVDVDYDVR